MSVVEAALAIVEREPPGGENMLWSALLSTLKHEGLPLKNAFDTDTVMSVRIGNPPSNISPAVLMPIALLYIPTLGVPVNLNRITAYEFGGKAGNGVLICQWGDRRRQEPKEEINEINEKKWWWPF
jgi:hypothetical protein